MPSLVTRSNNCTEISLGTARLEKRPRVSGGFCDWDGCLCAPLSTLRIRLLLETDHYEKSRAEATITIEFSNAKNKESAESKPLTTAAIVPHKAIMIFLPRERERAQHRGSKCTDERQWQAQMRFTSSSCRTSTRTQVKPQLKWHDPHAERTKHGTKT